MGQIILALSDLEARRLQFDPVRSHRLDRDPIGQVDSLQDRAYFMKGIRPAAQYLEDPVDLRKRFDSYPVHNADTTCEERETWNLER